MRRRSRSRKTAAAAIAIAGAIVGAGAFFILRYVRTRVAPRDSRKFPDRHSKLPPPPVDAAPDIQRAIDGVGPLRHRHYEVDIANSDQSAPSLLQAIQSHLAELSPTSLAGFTKTVGYAGHMQDGDEYEIKMLGPWNGRVRVAEVAHDTFTLLTCEGHPEAGHIVFRVQNHALHAHAMQISVDSYARSRSATVELAYGVLGVGQQVQTEVWVTFLQRVAALAGMTRVPEVRIATEELVD